MGVGGRENALIVLQLDRRRFSLGFAHCRGRMWEELRWPGLVSLGPAGGGNLIRGLSPGQASPPSSSLQLEEAAVQTEEPLSQVSQQSCFLTSLRCG